MDKDMGLGLFRDLGVRLLLISVFFLCLKGPAHARYAAIIMNAHTGQIIHQENPDKITHPASLTKMMTLYKAFQALANGKLTFNQLLPVSRHASCQAPCKLGLRAGQTIKVKDAMMALITKSANDAAVVLAEALGKTESQFAIQMTAQAKQLGMRHTVFKNASGLPNYQQVTTARDMAKLSQALIQHFPNYYGYFSARDFQFKGKSHRNHNHLVGEVIGYGKNGPVIVDGIKTGFINASGFNLAASAKHSKDRLIGVVMGGDNRHWRDRRMKQLLTWAFGVEESTPCLINASASIGERGVPPPHPPQSFGKKAVKQKKKKPHIKKGKQKASKKNKAKPKAKKKTKPIKKAKPKKNSKKRVPVKKA